MVLCLLAVLPRLDAQTPSARNRYEAAQAREREARAVLAAPGGDTEAELKAIRATIGAYRQVVLGHPASGYCDNALWQAAHLAIDAFAQFGQDTDRRTASLLLRHLMTEYPASRLVERARADLEALTNTTSQPILVRDIRRSVVTDGTDIDIELGAPVVFREERLTAPPRLFVDLANTTTMEALRYAVLTYESGLVRQIRVAPRPNGITRIVLDIDGAERCRARLAANPHRLTLQCRVAAVSGAGPAAAPSAGPSPVRVSADPAMPTAATATPAAVIVAPPLRSTSSAPAANMRGGFSLARQLGLRVGRIVIDAGHGGHDPGAMGMGTTEAAITLDIALRLERLLANEPDIDVVLTRRTDQFVPLQERTAIANREAADLFVSIHVNANRDKTARGVETYLLNFASNADTAAVAARENASSTFTMSHLNDLVRQIALSSKGKESRDLAGQLQNSLVRRLRVSNRNLRDLGVKQAPFVVLVGAAMPSVLVEVAFLTHDQEGRLLARQAYRQRIAESLLDGIRRYLRSLKKTPIVANRQLPPPAVTRREW
jgi:N-acetylmuramoyl-L-alanine amidase